MRLKDKMAIVTGAGRERGIGFEVARQLAQHGYGVVITARGAEASKRAVELISTGQALPDGNVRSYGFDVKTAYSSPRGERCCRAYRHRRRARTDSSRPC